jgi:hypothetical protein
MSLGKSIGVLLIVGGALGLAYGGFTYTKDTHTATIGPIVLAVQERETVLVPVVLSAAAVALGLALLLTLKNR